MSGGSTGKIHQLLTDNVVEGRREPEACLDRLKDADIGAQVNRRLRESGSIQGWQREMSETFTSISTLSGVCMK